MPPIHDGSELSETEIFRYLDVVANRGPLLEIVKLELSPLTEVKRSVKFRALEIGFPEESDSARQIEAVESLISGIFGKITEELFG